LKDNVVTGSVRSCRTEHMKYFTSTT
jgi:hypothetical protein